MTVAKVSVRDWTDVGGSINRGQGSISSSHASKTEVWLTEPTTGREERVVANNFEVPVREGQNVRIVRDGKVHVAMKNLATGERIQLANTTDLLTPPLSLGGAMLYTCFAWVGIVVALFLAIYFLNVTRFGFGDTFWAYAAGFMFWLIGGREDRLRYKRELAETRAEVTRLLG